MPRVRRRRDAGWVLLERVAVGLLLLNVATLGVLWWLPRPPPSLPPSDRAPRPPPQILIPARAPPENSGLVALDSILADRLERVAAARGVDPAPLVPPAPLRAELLAAADDDPAAVRRLIAAWASAYDAAHDESGAALPVPAGAQEGP